MTESATTPSLAVVIVSYNVRFFLEQALRAVFQSAGDLSVEVWVVDNQSSDDSVSMVRERFPSVRLLANSRNLGFARANNQALAQITAPYVLLLNPDTLLQEDTLSRCLRFLEANPSAGALGVRMIDGSGHFLPESKRGLPTPWVAFCRISGLSALFPKSRLFNTYNLGFLPEHQTVQVPVLSGAFFLLRRKALERAGYLDERFFMYGEDIDLSVRIGQAGYTNWYFPETTIIHYKGESTRKGSVNYVRIFHEAMVLFARKHFSGSRRSLYLGLLTLAIFLHAVSTLLATWGRRWGMPLTDLLLIGVGLLALQYGWAIFHFEDAGYYPARTYWMNAPLYTGIWAVSLHFSGAYSGYNRLGTLLSGILLGALAIAAVYGFLGPDLRTSRALILLATGWNLLLLPGIRLLLFPTFRQTIFRRRRFLLVGSQPAGEGSGWLPDQVGYDAVSVGIVSPLPLGVEVPGVLGHLEDLEVIGRIHRVDDILFHGRDVLPSQMMYWMSRLGNQYKYRILQEADGSLIGSASRNKPGELFSFQIRLHLADPGYRRQKRTLDVVICFLLLLVIPLVSIARMRALLGRLYTHIPQVMRGKRTWFGYVQSPNTPTASLPPIPRGVMDIEGRFTEEQPQEMTNWEKANAAYARDFTMQTDLNLWRKVLSSGR